MTLSDLVEVRLSEKEWQYLQKSGLLPSQRHMTAAQFLRGLVSEVPELQALFDEHIVANDEVVPHVFMADLTGYVIAAVQTPEQRPTVLHVLSVRERGYDRGGEIEELVAVSFLENLVGESEALSVLWPSMSPKLRAEYERLSN